MTARPAAKRAIWRLAQGSRLPLAAEYSMAKPIPATATTKRTNSQLSERSFRQSVSSGRLKASFAMLRVFPVSVAGRA